MMRNVGDTTTGFHVKAATDGWTDPWGDSHYIEVLHETVPLTITGTHTYNNGYADQDSVRATDAIGRDWYLRIPTDFGGVARWVPVNHDGPQLQATLPRRCVTPDGTPIVSDDPADTLRAALADKDRLERVAHDLLAPATTAIFGDDPYAGYFGWTFTYAQDTDEVAIRAWTYGGYMDSVKQMLPVRRFRLDDLDRVIAGDLDPTPERI